ncbi:hypothetical protein EV361DRAFT_912274 [Lentinula raphanica]|nr:hypothetical protein EV361DRAFT_912274 [Lentinula raphanica]
MVPFGPVLLTPLVSGLSLFSPAWGLSLLNLASVGSIGAFPGSGTCGALFCVRVHGTFGALSLCSPGLLVPLCLCSPGLLVPISLLYAGTSGAPVLYLWGGPCCWPPLVCMLVSAYCILCACHWFLTWCWLQILSLLSGVGLTGRTVS